METFLKRTDDKVYHMAEDLWRQGFILFSDGNSVKTTNGATTETIAGQSKGGYREGQGTQAMFNATYGFVQQSSTLVIVVDRYNHCLRSLDRRTRMTEVFAGRCRKSGFRNDGAKSMFDEPHSIIRDLKSKSYLVTDLGNNAIRKVASDTKSVSTLKKSDSLRKPRGITQDETSGDFYIITYHALFRLSYATNKLQLLGGSEDKAVVNGKLSQARFSYPSEIIMFNKGTYSLIADGRQLRLIDMRSQMVTSICTGVNGHNDGPVNSCTVYYPNSLLIVKNVLYIGENRSIRKVQGNEILFYSIGIITYPPCHQLPLSQVATPNK